MCLHSRINAAFAGGLLVSLFNFLLILAVGYIDREDDPGQNWAITKQPANNGASNLFIYLHYDVICTSVLQCITNVCGTPVTPPQVNLRRLPPQPAATALMRSRALK